MPNNIEIYHGKKNIQNIKYSGKIGKISILENFYGEIAKIEILQKDYFIYSSNLQIKRTQDIKQKGEKRDTIFKLEYANYRINYSKEIFMANDP